MTSATSSSPLQGVEVCAEAELFGGCSQTGATGEYTIAELPEGLYTVVFKRYEAEGFEYLTQYYNDAATLAEASAVAVVAEAATPGIDAAMQRLKLPRAPTAETLAASEVKATSATLNATVNPNGAEVSECELEYGTSIAYGKAEPCPTPPGAGTSAVAESVPVTGLEANREYHFRVRAKNAAGTGSGEDETFRTLPFPPVLTGVSPDVGLEAGHTTVSISGTELAGAIAVHFGSAEALHFTVDSATEITAESPPGVGTVHVTVSNTGGTSATSRADEFSYVPSAPTPTITKLSAKKGLAAGGTGTIISGTGFVGVTAVRFGSTDASSFKVESTSSIAVVVPPGTTGKIPVTVTTPDGTSGPSSKAVFEYGAPTVTGLSPASGSRTGGTAVTVTGSGFAPGAGLSAFKIGKASAGEVSCSSSTTCKLKTPPASMTGAVDVRATVAGKSSKKDRRADQFTYD